LKINKHFDKDDVEFDKKIKELKEKAAYVVRVKAKNGSGWGGYCQPQAFITPKSTLKSNILTEKEVVWLFSKILPKDLQGKKLELIFRASTDGYTAYNFHQKCDNKGATIVIVHSSYDHVFGGYTSSSWTSQNIYVNDTKAFIFLLRSKTKKPERWDVTNAPNAFYTYSSYGPTFGSGHDFYICDSCNSTTGSYSNLGNSYNAPKDTTMLAGAYNFTVKDYEVFTVS